jgi:hypothetical protein
MISLPITDHTPFPSVVSPTILLSEIRVREYDPEHFKQMSMRIGELISAASTLTLPVRFRAYDKRP